MKHFFTISLVLLSLFLSGCDIFDVVTNGLNDRETSQLDAYGMGSSDIAGFSYLTEAGELDKTRLVIFGSDSGIYLIEDSSKKPRKYSFRFIRFLNELEIEYDLFKEIEIEQSPTTGSYSEPIRHYTIVQRQTIPAAATHLATYYDGELYLKMPIDSLIPDNVAEEWSKATATLIEEDDADLAKTLGGSAAEIAYREKHNGDFLQNNSENYAVPVHFTRSKQGVWEWKNEFTVDSSDAFNMVFLANNNSQWEAELTSPLGAKLRARDFRADPESDNSNMAGLPFSMETFSFNNQGVGKWSARITAKSDSPNSDAPPEDGMLLMGYASPYQLSTQISNDRTIVGSKIFISVKIIENTDYYYMGDDESNLEHDPNDASSYEITESAPSDPLKPDMGDQHIEWPTIENAIHSATATITLPSGKTVTIPLKDDGNGQDALAGDSIFSGEYQLVEAGEHAYTIQAMGLTPEGLEFNRSSLSSFPVLGH